MSAPHGGRPLPSGRPLRVAIAGAGMISLYHLIAWSRVDGVELCAIIDPDAERARARAAAFGIARDYRSLDALLAHEKIDALDIATPRETHAALVRTAAAHGIAVLCQKPLAVDLAEAEALAAEVADRIRLMVHENWRFRPYYRQIAAWLAEGRFGELASGTISIRSSGILPDATGRSPALERQPMFRTEPRLLIAESLIHHIDVARWLFGPLRLVAARRRRMSDAVTGETLATLLFETGEGAPLVIDGNYACPGFAPSSRDRVELIGSRASIVMCEDRLSLLGDRAETIGYEHDTAYQESFDAAIRHFVECLASGEPFETDVADNLETIRLLEAAYADAAG
ncbi:Gfo/Idh/MocA family protein [Acuticoccus kandeliae]|uniref:Gfo/Idh/MocA family protein n=1 Tax=Acuticoccus kandeliae TaxID=2073160 RepID=UPI000D3E94D0|nr:Gfo/Idh/MocA family oxidoreductase [Acuticoccus kandeliae]